VTYMTYMTNYFIIFIQKPIALQNSQAHRQASHADLLSTDHYKQTRSVTT